MRALNPEKIEFVRGENGGAFVNLVWPDGYREGLFHDGSVLADWREFGRECAKHLLLELVGRKDHYQEFNANFIAKIPREGRELDVSVILSWLAMREQHYELPLGV